MAAQLQQIAQNPQVRSALDWTVFTLGALSLSVAITATVLSH